MQTLSVQLDDAKYQALDSLARKCGLATPEELVARQIDAFLAAEFGEAAGAALIQHLTKVIGEDFGLLKRLAD